jgi:hypothetical protein
VRAVARATDSRNQTLCIKDASATIRYLTRGRLFTLSLSPYRSERVSRWSAPFRIKAPSGRVRGQSAKRSRYMIGIFVAAAPLP